MDWHGVKYLIEQYVIDNKQYIENILMRHVICPTHYYPTLECHSYLEISTIQAGYYSYVLYRMNALFKQDKDITMYHGKQKYYDCNGWRCNKPIDIDDGCMCVIYNEINNKQSYVICVFVITHDNIFVDNNNEFHDINLINNVRFGIPNYPRIHNAFRLLARYMIKGQGHSHSHSHSHSQTQTQPPSIRYGLVSGYTYACKLCVDEGYPILRVSHVYKHSDTGIHY